MTRSYLSALYDCYFVPCYDSSFAVDSTKPVMIPKDPSITQAGAEELSALDIRKLRRGYHCESSTEVILSCKDQ